MTAPIRFYGPVPRYLEGLDCAGKLIVVEGTDGVGRSTHISLLREWLEVSGYAVANPGLAAPIRLSFQRMEARVADQCGLWPQDLGVSSPLANLRNEPSWNLGCSTQATLAAQVADPVDLVRGRTEGRIDTVRRVKDIDQLRAGKDPSTKWSQDGQTSVSSRLGL